ncbi:MAG: Rieske iron-sulfur protein [Verrucomicrobiales bacterium]|jgi:menaquinol-cytochrome c reductase iron-sulfur subunit|nr:Rieske iron-sulfur protein [Verrucomicrobiales bacterium]
MSEEVKPNPPAPERRSFLKEAAIMAIGGVATLVPLGAGIAVLLDPLRRNVNGGSKIRVTSLDALPKDGTPRKFPILASRTDAWNKYPDAPVGAVYLRRTPDGKIQALNVVCPHAGCFVDFRENTKNFFCPCHNSSFAVDGKIDDPKSPSPRAMDELQVEVKGSDVWVRFENFQTGRADKIPA